MAPNQPVNVAVKEPGYLLMISFRCRRFAGHVLIHCVPQMFTMKFPLTNLLAKQAHSPRNNNINNSPTDPSA